MPLPHIAQRFLQYLAHLARHGARDFFFALRQEVPGAPYHSAAQRSGRSAPAFESAAGAGCGPLDISARGAGPKSNYVGGIRWIAGLEVLTVCGYNPLARDEILELPGH